MKEPPQAYTFGGTKQEKNRTLSYCREAQTKKLCQNCILSIIAGRVGLVTIRFSDALPIVLPVCRCLMSILMRSPILLLGR